MKEKRERENGSGKRLMGYILIELYYYIHYIELYYNALNL
jgi:hypothetical protein